MAKKSDPCANKDYLAVALSFLVIKNFERLVMAKLQADVGMHSDPLLFAYQLQRGVDDDVLILLHEAITYLEKSHISLVLWTSPVHSTQCNHTLWDISSSRWKSTPHLILWVLSFLTGRGQRVRMVRMVTLALLGNYPPSPQGSVISPLLSTSTTTGAQSLE